MTLKYNFNDYDILTSYVNQAVPQIFPEEKVKFVRRMIVVGEHGGLAYRLFPFSTSEDHSLIRPCMTDVVKKHFDNVKNCINKAHEYATTFDLDVVGISKNKVKNNFDFLVDDAGIGSISIESTEELERFLEMVKGVGLDLKKDIAHIVAVAYKLRRNTFVKE